MIWILKQKKPQPRSTWKHVFITLLLYSLPLLVTFYGFKCLVTQRATIESGRWSPLVAVRGSAAILAGWSYISLVAGMMLMNSSAKNGSSWIGRFVRALLPWPAFAMAVWLQHESYLLSKSPGGATASLSPGARATLGLVFSGMTCVVALLCFLSAMYGRENVKRDLARRGCKPLHVWWCPISDWAVDGGTPFRVVYEDSQGNVRIEYCCTTRHKPKEVIWSEF